MNDDTTTHVRSMTLRLLFVRFAITATRKGQTTALSFAVVLFNVAVSFTLHYFGNE
jgi:hypothetical protein